MSFLDRCGVSEMSAANVPAYTKMMWPVIQALKQLGGSGGVDELLSEVTDVMSLSTEVQNVPHGDGRQSKVDYNMRWAMTYLKKAGYVDNSARAVWSLTPQGEVCTAADVAAVPSFVRKKSADERKSGRLNAQPLDDFCESPVSLPEHEQEPDWKDALLSQLRC